MSRRSLRERITDLRDRAMERLVPEGDVQQRTVRGTVWVAAMNVTKRFVKVVELIVLARLLTPADFGLLGIALVVVAGLERLSELRVDAALIQKREDDVTEYLDTAWVIRIVRGVLVAALAFVVAPYAARFFQTPAVTDVIRVLGITPLLRGLANPGVIYFRKNLEFHRELSYRLIGPITGVAVSIGVALVSPSVWAFVFGMITSSVAQLLTSYVIHDHSPAIRFDVEHARELFGYGKWLAVSSMLVFLYSQGDDAFIGWFFGATVLGYYQIAYRFSNTPIAEVTNITSKVTFPLYSRVQDDGARLRNAYVRVVQLTAFVAFPAAVGIVVTAPVFVVGFLGEKWLPAVTALQLLTAWGLMRAIGATTGPLFKAIGRPDFTTKVQVLLLVSLAALIYPFSARWGLEGSVLAVVGSQVVPAVLSVVIALRVLDIEYRRFLAALFYPAAGSVFMGAVAYVVREGASGVHPILAFFLVVGAGIASYAVAVVLLERRFDIGLAENAQTLRSQF